MSDRVMSADLAGPADTAMMGIVHGALRRDLARARAALSAGHCPADDQRMAIAAHLVWLMDFLHRHHTSEDEGLYPLVRSRSQAAAEMLDVMDADHHRIGPAMDGLRAAADGYAKAASGRTAVLAALGRLDDVLIPHLRREEDEMMPLVSAAITEAQWQEIEQKYNVKPLGPLELADTGLWILDGLEGAERAKVEGLVPPVPRWIINNLLAGRYRRAAFRRWRLQEHSPFRVPLSGQVEVTTPAAPAAVWAILADVTRVGEWSHECHTAQWLDGATAAAPGARFRGRNRSGRISWARACTITACDPPRELIYHTSGGFFGDSSEWRFVLEPADGGGTVIRQSFRVLAGRVWADRLIWRLVPAHHDRLAALRGDLTRLAALAAAQPAPAPV
jgi:hemerythrin-like domain-containing protein